MVSNALKESIKNNPHLGVYLKKYKEEAGKLPEFQVQLSRDLKSDDVLNLLYPVGDPIFIHVFTKPDGANKYNAIQPQMDEDIHKKYDIP